MYRYLKRWLDILLSFIALIALSSVFLLICMAIKLESKGPIFFRQQRIGLHGKQFSIYKFRSMKTDTPNVSTDKLGDPSSYVTKVGKFLRKTSLDELPQLINILKGDMSIIGPRPALYNQDELNAAREEENIHVIRPGLTGYAQIMGRDFITDQQKVQYDKFYLEHMSLKLDIKIFFKTFISVFQAEGVRT